MALSNRFRKALRIQSSSPSIITCGTAEVCLYVPIGSQKTDVVYYGIEKGSQIDRLLDQHLSARLGLRENEQVVYYPGQPLQLLEVAGQDRSDIFRQRRGTQGDLILALHYGKRSSKFVGHVGIEFPHFL